MGSPAGTGDTIDAFQEDATENDNLTICDLEENTCAIKLSLFLYFRLDQTKVLNSWYPVHSQPGSAPRPHKRCSTADQFNMGLGNGQTALTGCCTGAQATPVF